MSEQTLLLRVPIRDDGADIWRLAGSCGLDSNSPYMYLLWCHDFADSSVVAEVDGAIVGFVIGYRRPIEPSTVFVWQIGVTEVWRRQGLALAMLTHLRDRLAPDLRFLEASVTPSNHASTTLFQSLATSSGVELASAELFNAQMFPPGSRHETERLVRIGPFTSDVSAYDFRAGVEGLRSCDGETDRPARASSVRG